ncbi:MAG: LytR/AlgR family response regulator transcription factor [Anaerovoracaceae bacterium]
MFRIAICDDEQIICSKIEDVILKYSKEMCLEIDTQVFYSGEELYKFLLSGDRFDLIFLDIEMKMLDGIQVGRMIREELDNQTVQIVYISGKDNYYRALFDVRPMNFLNKPLEEEKIIKDIRLAMKLCDRFGGVFKYKKGQELHYRDINSILYFESIRRKIRVVTTMGDDTFYGKLDDVYKEVAKHHFMFIHKSYIINPIFVTQFKYEDVTMSNSEVLPISQSRRKSIRQTQIKFEKEGVL